MDILSTCYCRQGKQGVSLLLQQYRYKGVRIIFACIFMGMGENMGRAGGYMAEQTLQWFRGLNLKKLARGKEKYMERLGKSLQQVILDTDRVLDDSGIMSQGVKVNLAGMVCVENRILMLQRGAGRICLINRAFGRTHMRYLRREEDEPTIVERGILQPNVGILLSMNSFYDYITEKMVANGLDIREVVSEEQMYRHLQELGREAERLGGKEIGLILLRTK